MSQQEQIWTCTVGGVAGQLPLGADSPMRDAVQAAFQRITGNCPEFTFSGWGAKLTEPQRAVVENRMCNEEHHRDWLVKNAAHDLLAALHNMLEDGDKIDREQALRAIAKATGSAA